MNEIREKDDVAIIHLKHHVCELINYRSISVDTLFENILTSRAGPMGCLDEPSRRYVKDL